MDNTQAQIRLKPITAAQVATREALESVGREIIKGRWAEDNEMAGKQHGRIGGRLYAYLFMYLQAQPIGEAYPDNVNYVLEGTPENIVTMRIPDVSFVRAARVDHQDPGYYYLAPDLAVEVLSPSERPATTQSKIDDYLQQGTAQVWVIDPVQERVSVYQADQPTAHYMRGQVLEGGALLPGFSLALDTLFESGLKPNEAEE